MYYSPFLCAMLSMFCAEEQQYAVMTFDATLPATSFVIPGDNFYTNVLEFSAQQQAEFKSRALEYYEQKFGLTEVESNRNLHTMLFQTNPAVGAQTYLLEEEGEEPAQDAARLETYSGGWMVRIVNRNGLTLGGEYGGVFVQFGTTFSIGHWLLRGADKDYVWEIEDSRPGSIAQYEIGLITGGEITVHSDEYGNGTASHRTHYNFDANQNAHAVFISNITFPAFYGREPIA